MVDQHEFSGNPDDILAARIALGTLKRLREVLQGQRCAVCLAVISPENPAALSIFDMVVCRRLGCASLILDAPLSQFADNDNEGDAHE
jgi:hypothetical protein